MPGLYEYGCDLTVTDWRIPKSIINPCPVCKKEMKETFRHGDFVMLECDAPGCSGREVRGVCKSQKA